MGGSKKRCHEQEEKQEEATLFFKEARQRKDSDMAQLRME
jgi:hypothetical protein